MTRYVCVHGHFYQPPRENPWTDIIAKQPSASPFADWNQRITHECYARNGAAHVRGPDGAIVDSVNNYERMSFNFGPTLLRWLERHEPGVYATILAADEASKATLNGHGAAIAQGYHHAILPLANARDKQTEVLWGLKDFGHRFRRPAEGMWLPETAVDTATLEALAEHGVTFTILAPHQAKRVRALSSEAWVDVDENSLDKQRAYLVRLPSGRTITLFFYDGAISRSIAFEGLLEDGAKLAHHLRRAVAAAPNDKSDDPRLLHIATDGETYGHHHRFGEMALAFALRDLQRNTDVKLTHYAEFLGRHPPMFEVQIAENTSWSCAHGVERWRSDCGCHMQASIDGVAWNQKWRKGLREGFDWLRDTLYTDYEERAGKLFKDPTDTRNAYIDILLDRSAESIGAFFAEHARRELSPDERVTALKLLEVQRHVLMSYTSCAWFFDDVGGVEPRQNLRCAARAIALSAEVMGKERGAHIEREFKTRLTHSKSNVPPHVGANTIFDEVKNESTLTAEHLALAAAAARQMGDATPGAGSQMHEIHETDHISVRHNGWQLDVDTARVICLLTGDDRGATVIALAACGPERTETHYFTRPERLANSHRDELTALFAAQTFPPTASENPIPEVLLNAVQGLGFAPRTITRKLASMLESSARRGALEALDSPSAQADLRFHVLRAVNHSENDAQEIDADAVGATDRALLTLLVQQRLTRAFERGCVDHHPGELTALTVLARAQKIKLDTAVLIEAAISGARSLLAELEQKSAEAARRLALMRELAEHLQIHVDMWEVERACIRLREDAPSPTENSAPPAQDAWALAFSELCTTMHICNPEPTP